MATDGSGQPPRRRRTPAETGTERQPRQPRSTAEPRAAATRPARTASPTRRPRAVTPAPPPPPEEARTPLGAISRGAGYLLLAALVLSAISVFGATKLRADARVDLLADTSSATYQQQSRFADAFGGDPVVILLEPSPNQPLLTGTHFVAFATLEGKLASSPNVQRVYGPGTLVNTFATQVTKRLVTLCETEGTAAESAAKAQAAKQGKSAQDQQKAGNDAFANAVRACLRTLLAEFPSIGIPALNNPDFIRAVLLEPDGKHIRPFWNWALPDTNHAVITVRMKRTASLADVRQLEQRIRDGAKDKNLSDVHLITTGAPVLTRSLADAALPPVHSPSDLGQAIVDRTLLGLLPATLLAMLLVTIFVLRVPFRLVAVPLAALAALWAGGVAGLLNLPVTPASLAVLPVVLGLATDYSLQAANRLAEETGEPGQRLVGVARAILPPTLIAAAATALGVLAFALSPIPLVRQFAFFMALGVAASYLVSVLVGLPLFSLALRAGVSARLPGWLTAANAPAPWWTWLGRIGRLPLVAALGLCLLGLPGWLALNHLKIETDPAKLMPAGDQALADADLVQRTIGLAGELDLVVEGRDASSANVVSWMSNADKQVTTQSGGSLKTLTGFPEFLAGFNKGQIPDDQTVKLILDRVPGYFTGAVITSDKKMARTPFGLTHLTSVEEDKQLVDQVRSVKSPPAGYQAYPAGLAVIASSALASLTGDQLKLNALALALVLVVLLIAYRRPLPALLAVLPTAVAAGWITGLIFVLGFRSSPITILLAGVVVAFATEFSVLWLSRYRAELRERGGDRALAADVASRRIGPAVLASAAALVLGFAVLGLSPVPMVRDFGIWSAADLALATAAVLVLLPPVARQWLAE